jgi:hypothetical protein
MDLWYSTVFVWEKRGFSTAFYSNVQSSNLGIFPGSFPGFSRVVTRVFSRVFSRVFTRVLEKTPGQRYAYYSLRSSPRSQNRYMAMILAKSATLLLTPREPEPFLVALEFGLTLTLE